MTSRLLLDTHIVIRWLSDPATLSREQSRVLREAMRRQQTVALSAISLLEIALLMDGRDRRVVAQIQQVLDEIELSPTFQILPLTLDIAREVAPLIGLLRDPSDCVIVATGRVHGLRLLSSDQRILDSNLASTIG